MKAFVSVLGMDQKGIISKISGVLAARQVNILDLNQTIVEGYFQMVMFIEMADMSIELSDLKSELDMIGDQLNLKIRVQEEAIFSAMHKI